MTSEAAINYLSNISNSFFRSSSVFVNIHKTRREALSLLNGGTHDAEGLRLLGIASKNEDHFFKLIIKDLPQVINTLDQINNNLVHAHNYHHLSKEDFELVGEAINLSARLLKQLKFVNSNLRHLTSRSELEIKYLSNPSSSSFKEVVEAFKGEEKLYSKFISSMKWVSGFEKSTIFKSLMISGITSTLASGLIYLHTVSPKVYTNAIDADGSLSKTGYLVVGCLLGFIGVVNLYHLFKNYQSVEEHDLHALAKEIRKLNRH